MAGRGRLGIVSNCWRSRLEAGVALESLIADAAERGFCFIELRQGCLGDGEDRDSLLPRVDRLAALSRRFPTLRFNLAVQLPVFTTDRLVESPGMARILDAAAAVGGHLRLVDLTNVQPIASDEFLESRSAELDQWMSRLGAGGIVSIEHALQPWHAFWAVFEPLRRLTHGVLKLCYDPCNLLLTDEGDRATGITASIPIDAVSMVHLKQSRNGVILPSFASTESLLSPDGIDWPDQIRLLNERQYAGPILFEIAPSDDAQSHLTAAREWVIDRLSEACDSAGPADISG